MHEVHWQCCVPITTIHVPNLFHLPTLNVCPHETHSSFPPQAMATIILSLWLLGAPHLSGTIQDLAFCTWIMCFSTMFRIIHVVAGVRTSFQGWIIFHCVIYHILFICLSVNWLLCCSYIFFCHEQWCCEQGCTNICSCHALPFVEYVDHFVSNFLEYVSALDSGLLSDLLWRGKDLQCISFSRDKMWHRNCFLLWLTFCI